MTKNINEIIELLQDNNLLLQTFHLDSDFTVEDITYDSREVKDHSLFFCKGLRFKEEYLQQAIKNGAVAYIAEKAYSNETAGIIVKDVRKAMLLVAAFFFDYPDRKLTTIGVTGTKGKTTTVKFLKSIFDCYLAKRGAKSCGLLSSINVYDGISDQGAGLTTPEAIPLYRHLANAVQAGLTYMVIEVSSQGLKMNRVNTVEFDMGAFLNISPDHISDLEHPNMEDYLQSKLKLIDQSKAFVVNSQTDYFDEVLARIKDHMQDYATFSLDHTDDTIFAKDIQLQGMDVTFTGVCNHQEARYRIHEPGFYNVENALCAIYIAKYFGLDEESIREGLDKAKVEGRNFIFVTDDQKIIVWISFAHNRLSFEQNYTTIRSLYGDIKILSMYGSPGDTSQNRLRDLSIIGAENSDIVIFVPEDPGSRPFLDTAKEMSQIASQYPCRIEICDNRGDGVRRAFELAKQEDKILLFLAGNAGCEVEYVNGQHLPVESDVVAAKACLAAYNQALQKNKAD